nr:DnaD domain protein [Ornithinibacillus caprae]
MNRHTSSLIKQNHTKQNNRNHITDAVTFYQDNFGDIREFVLEELLKWIEAVGEELVLEAMKRALENNKGNWGYVQAILKAWLQKGLHSLDAVREEEVAFWNQKKQTASRSGRNRLSNSKEIVPDWFRERKDKEREKRRIQDSVKFDENGEDVEALLARFKKEGSVGGGRRGSYEG